MAESDITDRERNALGKIRTETDPAVLRRWIKNARAEESRIVEREAFARLCVVQPSAVPGSIEHDVWRSVYALEEILSDERGRTARLSRTRQKIARDGETRTAADLTLKPNPSAGFHELIARGHPEFTFEAVVLRHPNIFEPPVLDAARERLRTTEVDFRAELGD